MTRRILNSAHTNLLLVAALSFAIAAPAFATVSHYRAILNGASEAPPNASPGVGVAEVTIDDVAHTMQIQASFSGLLGTTSACHIHAPTAVALTGTAGVATTTPSFVGFPLGVMTGLFNNTLDLTLASSYNPAYITANGGTTATAEAALLAAIVAGRSYFNVHSTSFPGGEIRGFLQQFDPTPASRSTWSRVKSLYR